MRFGMGELLVIGGIILLLFGAKKLPAVGSSMAQAIKNFQKGMKGDEETKKVDHTEQD